MAKSVALAYSIAGTAIAAAVIVISATTVGLVNGGQDSQVEAIETAVVTVDSSLGVVEGIASSSSRPGAPGSQVVTTASGEQVEYVYVDEPASWSHDDDDDDHDDHDEHDDDHDDDDDDDDDDHEDDD